MGFTLQCMDIFMLFNLDEFLKEVKEINQIYEEYMQDIYKRRKNVKLYGKTSSIRSS